MRAALALALALGLWHGAAEGAPGTSVAVQRHKGSRTGPARYSYHARGQLALPDASETQHEAMGMLEAESALETHADGQLQAILAGSSGLWSTPRLKDDWERDLVRDDDDSGVAALYNKRLNVQKPMAKPVTALHQFEALDELGAPQSAENSTASELKKDEEWKVKSDKDGGGENASTDDSENEPLAAEQWSQDDAQAKVFAVDVAKASAQVAKAKSTLDKEEAAAADEKAKVKILAKEFNTKHAAAKVAEQVMFDARSTEDELAKKKEQLAKEAEESLAAVRAATVKASLAYEQVLRDLEQKQSEVRALREAHLSRSLEAKEAKDALERGLARVKDGKERSKALHAELRVAEERFGILTGHDGSTDDKEEKDGADEKNGAPAVVPAAVLFLAVASFALGT